MRAKRKIFYRSDIFIDIKEEKVGVTESNLGLKVMKVELLSKKMVFFVAQTDWPWRIPVLWDQKRRKWGRPSFPTTKWLRWRRTGSSCPRQPGPACRRRWPRETSFVLTWKPLSRCTPGGLARNKKYQPLLHACHSTVWHERQLKIAHNTRIFCYFPAHGKLETHNKIATEA